LNVGALYNRRGCPLREALRRLLDDFDAIEADHGEVYDTDVREAIGLCLHNALFSPQAGYQIPRRFEMLTDEGNASVAAALERFLNHTDAVALARSALSPAERLAAFEDRSVRSARGNSLNETIGLVSAPRRRSDPR
jgi:hypothetical protein